MKNKEKLIQEVKNRIDDYNNTVYAILGFLNTYKYELTNENKNICLFQGRKLVTGNSKTKEVTPDFGLTMDDEGLVGEVKYSFPMDQTHWQDDFDQLKKYEEINSAWPTDKGTVKEFDIVLLVQQNRSRSVKDYYIGKVPDEKKITKAFAIIEFNRSSQGKEFFHFRIEHGQVSSSIIQEKLYNGIYLPLDVFINLYARVKIYDVEPPLPLVLLYMYETVVDKAKEDDLFKKLTPKSSLSIPINFQDITTRLQEIYSFKGIQPKKFSKNQPTFPKQEWIRKAFDKLAELEEGTWTNRSAGEFTYLLSQKEGSILDHYILKTIGSTSVQPELFS